MVADPGATRELRGPAFEVDFHSHDPQWLAKAVAEMEGDPPLVRYKTGIGVSANEMSHLGTASRATPPVFGSG